MNFRVKNALAPIFLAAISTVLLAPAGLCDGALSAESEASNSNGFPVSTGPGNTVLTPEGAYSVPIPPSYNRPVKSAPAGAHMVNGKVKYYNWLSSRHPAQVRHNIGERERLSSTSKVLH